MDKVLKDLCLEIASGDIGGESFNRLWIESGIPLEGAEFEVANRILTRSQESSSDEFTGTRTMH